MALDPDQPSAATDTSRLDAMPAFTAEDRQAQSNLSRAAALFLDHVERHPRLLRRDTFEPLFAALRSRIRNVPGMPAEQRYGIQPWPTLISTPRQQELERASIGLSRLVRDIPRRVFDNDARKTADYFQLESEALARLLLSEPTGFDAAICRVDLFDTPQGLKCLEVNAGSVGGWQDTAFAPAFLEDDELGAFFGDSGITPNFVDSIRIFFRNILRAYIADPVSNQREVNVLFVTNDEGLWSDADHPRQIYENEMATALREVGNGWTGRVSVQPMSRVAWRNEELWIDGVRYHAVFEQLDRITEVSRALFRAFKARRLHLFTGPISLILGDKRSLALLSKLQTSRLFTPEERELIERYVPWTRLVGGGLTIYRGSRVAMPKLLATERENLVLKAGQSYAGKDIVVGRATESAEWTTTIERALDEGGWVVQEYLEPIPYMYQTGECGCCPHELVWGSFVYGSNYAGTYARMMPRGRGAVINVSLGAVVGIVFEVDE